MCPVPSYLPNWLLGWEMNMGNIVHTHTHIYPVGIYDMTCRGISEKAHENPTSTSQGYWLGVLYIGKDYHMSDYVIYIFTLFSFTYMYKYPWQLFYIMRDMPHCCYHLTIIVLLSLS